MSRHLSHTIDTATYRRHQARQGARATATYTIETLPALATRRMDGSMSGSSYDPFPTRITLEAPKGYPVCREF